MQARVGFKHFRTRVVFMFKYGEVLGYKFDDNMQVELLCLCMKYGLSGALCDEAYFIMNLQKAREGCCRRENSQVSLNFWLCFVTFALS